MVGVGRRAGDRHVMEDDKAAVGEAAEQAGGGAFAAGAVAPRAGVTGGPKPQPPADHHPAGQPD
jgi:hypothetical protein